MQNEIFERYEELLEKKKELADETKANNTAIKDLEEEIETEMAEDEVTSITVNGHSYTLVPKTRYAKLGDEKLEAKGLNFYEVLREQGYGDLIHETVNANTLNATMAAAAEENDGELPEELAEVVSSYDYTDIQRRKATSKAARVNKKA